MKRWSSIQKVLNKSPLSQPLQVFIDRHWFKLLLYMNILSGANSEMLIGAKEKRSLKAILSLSTEGIKSKKIRHAEKIEAQNEKREKEKPEREKKRKEKAKEEKKKQAIKNPRKRRNKKANKILQVDIKSRPPVY